MDSYPSSLRKCFGATVVAAVTMPSMSFCEHCEGQRFDRARVLRALRQVQRELRASRAGATSERVIIAALSAIRDLDIPHLEFEPEDDVVVH